MGKRGHQEPGYEARCHDDWFVMLQLANCAEFLTEFAQCYGSLLVTLDSSLLLLSLCTGKSCAQTIFSTQREKMVWSTAYPISVLFGLKIDDATS